LENHRKEPFRASDDFSIILKDEISNSSQRWIQGRGEPPSFEEKSFIL
jgi:hypothetical protein